MIIDYVISNFELIVFISLSLIVICCILIFYLQNNFISITSKNLEKLSTSIRSSNLELADYLKTLSSVLEDKKNNIENMAEIINSLEKEVTRMTDVKGTDQMISLAIELARNGEEKEIIKEKTGLTDDEIDTLHAYHRNLKV